MAMLAELDASAVPRAETAPPRFTDVLARVLRRPAEADSTEGQAP
jgi:hypothetical protein